MKDLVKNINSDVVNSSELLVQYRNIKAQNIDYIVLFRVGEFYESYFDDACVVSSACSINLGRKHFKFGDVNLAGFTYSKKEEFIKKLLDKGHKIALCEEFEDETNCKIKARKVVRKYTQGVLFDEELLDPDEHNFLCAVSYFKNKAELAFSDVSTNEIYSTVVSCDKVLDEILKFKPSEILLSSVCEFSKELNSQISNLFHQMNITYVDEDCSKQNLQEQFDTPALNIIFS